MGMDESFADEELPEELRGRFTVKRIGAVCKGGMHVASAYLHISLGSSIERISIYSKPLLVYYLPLKDRGSWLLISSVRQLSWRRLVGLGWSKAE